MALLSQLKSMSDKEIQGWLRKIGQEKAHTLATALLGADESTKACVYRNMSEKAVSYLKQDLEKQKTAGVPQAAIQQCTQEMERLFH